MDVLKEMSDCVQLLYDEGNIHSASGLDDARDAVAELIDACNYLSRSAENEKWAAFHSALDKVKGL